MNRRLENNMQPITDRNMQHHYLTYYAPAFTEARDPQLR